MLLLDDHLTLLVVAGATPAEELGDDLATSSLWYLRLVAAVTAPATPERGAGRLARLLDTLATADREAAIARILDPPGDVIEVLHPMKFAVETARAQRELRLNLLAAETIGAAVHYGASIILAAPNRGGPIEHAAQQLEIPFNVQAS